MAHVVWNTIYYVSISAINVVNFGSLLPFREVALYKNQKVLVKTISRKFSIKTCKMQSEAFERSVGNAPPTSPYLNISTTFLS